MEQSRSIIPTEARMRFIPQGLKVFLAMLIVNTMVIAMLFKLQDMGSLEPYTVMVAILLIFYGTWRAASLADDASTFISGASVAALLVVIVAPTTRNAHLAILCQSSGLISFIMIALATALRALQARRNTAARPIPLLTLPGNPDDRPGSAPG